MATRSNRIVPVRAIHPGEILREELQERGISAEAVEMLQPILSLEGTNREKLAKIAQIISGSETKI